MTERELREASPEAGAKGHGSASRGTSGASSPEPGSTTLVVVIVNYKTPEITTRCLRSLAEEADGIPGLQAVVVDNDSGDGSYAALCEVVAAEGWASWLRVVAAERNGGYAYGTNRGLEAAPSAPYSLILNSDTVFEPGCLRHCLAVMESEPRIGVMSCGVVTEDGQPQAVAHRFPHPFRELVKATGLPWKFPRLLGWATANYFDETPPRRRDVDWVAGAFLLIRRAILDEIGGLDEEFFFYGEDVHFCHRVWRAGYRVHFDSRVSIVHVGGASSTPEILPERTRESYRWRARYLEQRKCYGRLAEWLVRRIDKLGYGSRLLWYRLAGRKDTPRYRGLRQTLEILDEQS